MARPLRIDYPGAWHHVTNRGARHQAIFLSHADRYTFLGLLAIVHERFDIRVNAFTLMGNHYHLLVETPEGGLSRAMHYLDGRYAQRFNQRNNFDGPLFKGRFHSKLVDTDGYCDRAARYVHRNPLEAKITDNLIEYPWSSYRWFMDPQRRLPAWLYRDALELGGLRTPAQLRRATELPLNSAERETFEGGQAVVGSDAFVKAALSNASTDHETAGHRATSWPKVPLVSLEKVVARELNHGLGVSRTGRQGKPDIARLVAVGLAQQIGRQNLQQIADRYGYSTPKSAGNAASRFRKALAEPDFAAEVERIVTLCAREGGR